MTEPVKNIRFGGVCFNENEIARKSVKVGANGEKIYSVFLKNGLQLSYPYQPAVDKHKDANGKIVEGRASVDSSLRGGLFYNEGFTVIADIKNAEIKGSDNVDKICLMASAENNKIDLTGDGTIVGDKVWLEPGTAHNEVILDKSDAACLINGDYDADPIKIKGPGTAAQDSYQ